MYIWFKNKYIVCIVYFFENLWGKLNDVLLATNNKVPTKNVRFKIELDFISVIQSNLDSVSFEKKDGFEYPITKEPYFHRLEDYYSSKQYLY